MSEREERKLDQKQGKSKEQTQVDLSTLISLQRTQGDILASLSKQLEITNCILEHISKQSCHLLNEAHFQTELQTSLNKNIETLLELYKSVHPNAALDYTRLQRMREEVKEHFPPKEPEPICVYKPCTPEDKPGLNESNIGKVNPNKAFGAQYPPAEHKEEEEPNDDRGRQVPIGPFRGFVVPSKELKPQDFRSGTAGDNPDPVVFGEYTPYGTVAAPMSSNAADISGSESGKVVLATGNWYSVYSTDGGSSFTTLDPTTVFPNTADGGFCCDQVIQYVPRIDRFIWLMQFDPGATGQNRLRIAAASPQDIINSNCTAWTYWDLTSSDFGFANDMDYPDMSVGNNFLYLSVDQRASGLLVVRIPLNEIQAGGTISFRFTTSSDSAAAYGGHICQNTGDEVFWGGCGAPKNNSTLQVFSWHENSTSYSWRDVGITNWPQDTITSNAPGGKDWLKKLDDFPKFGITGVTRRGDEVWFAWTASKGDGGYGGFNFPHPHVRVVKINVKDNYKVLEEMQIWNNDHAFAYPCLATNDRNEVGIALGWGGGNTFNASSAVGILGDFVVWYPELSDVSTTRWGDYVTARQASPNSSLFAGFGYAILKDTARTAGYRFDPFYILFGRNSIIHPRPR